MADTGRPRILLVDDRPEGLVALEAALHSDEYDIDTASSGAEALGQLLKGEYAVILLDVQMPELDGFETAKIIKTRERSRDIPIIFMTAISREEQFIMRGYQSGAVDYIVKPFNAEMLRSKVHVFVELQSKTLLLQRQAERLRATERLERENALARLELENLHRYHDLADSIPHIVWQAATPPLVDHFNLVWSEFTGLTQEQSIGHGWQNAIHSDDRMNVLHVWRRAIDFSESFDLELRVRRADGMHRWHLLRAVCPADKALGVWIATCTDIDDRKRAEQEQQGLAAENARLYREADQGRALAESANRSKDEFLATLSHELRTPINAILGWVQLLRSSNLDDDHKKHGLLVIERNTKVQVRLIDDLLDVSRIVSGKMSIEQKQVDLVPLTSAIIESMHLQAEKAGLELSLQMRAPNACVLGDASKLQQVFSNLLSNAVKFTPRGGTIEVAIERAGDNETLLSVTDTGKGIEPGFLPHVFDRFRQADSSMTRQHGGLGLGLAIARHIVELHGGSIRADSPGADQGTRFEVRLPLIAQPTLVMPAVFKRTTSQSRPTLRGVRVLLVEDDPDSREMVKAMIERAGAEVSAAASVKEAMNSLRVQEPDVLVSDIGMPDEDGFALVHQIRANPSRRIREIPAIALTAFVREEERQQALQAGYQRHLAKPVDSVELIETIAQVLSDAGSGHATLLDPAQAMLRS